ncbi:hypothetical protein [Paraburkholderia sp. UYCP14C]|uniref:hypothetical protein n=1 Tax=Paraburkholderia sp. UYCP14C TaxID=2511130 RepID=UPI00145A0029|nr:hypothetical protein [Paraburkholderia sp. UYCP14C]
MVLPAQRGRRLRLGHAPKQPVVFERGFGARSAAGGMTALSLALKVREHGFQMHHYRSQTGAPAYELAV